MSRSDMINNFLDAMSLIAKNEANTASATADQTVVMQIIEVNGNTYKLSYQGQEYSNLVSETKYKAGDYVYVTCRGGVGNSSDNANTSKIIVGKVPDVRITNVKSEEEYVTQGTAQITFASTVLQVVNQTHKIELISPLDDNFLKELSSTEVSGICEPWFDDQSYLYSWYDNEKNLSLYTSKYQPGDIISFNNECYIIGMVGTTGIYCKEKYNQDAFIAYVKENKTVELSTSITTAFHDDFYIDEDFEDCNFGIKAVFAIEDMDDENATLLLDIQNMIGFPWDQQDILYKITKTFDDVSKFYGLKELSLFVTNYPITSESFITFSNISLATALLATEVDKYNLKIAILNDVTELSDGAEMNVCAIFNAKNHPADIKYQWQVETYRGWQTVGVGATMLLNFTMLRQYKSLLRVCTTVDDMEIYSEPIEIINRDFDKLFNAKSTASGDIPARVQLSVFQSESGFTVDWVPKIMWHRYNTAKELIEAIAGDSPIIDLPAIDVKEYFIADLYEVVDLTEFYRGFVEIELAHQDRDYWLATKTANTVPTIKYENNKYIDEHSTKEWSVSIEDSDFGSQAPFLWNVKMTALSALTNGTPSFSMVALNQIFGSDHATRTNVSAYCLVTATEDTNAPNWPSQLPPNTKAGFNTSPWKLAKEPPVPNKTTPYCVICDGTKITAYKTNRGSETSYIWDSNSIRLIDIYGHEQSPNFVKQYNTFLSLTNNGESQGMYMQTDPKDNKEKLYVNADFIKTGTLLVDNKFSASIDKDEVKIGGWHVTDKGLEHENKTIGLYADSDMKFPGQKNEDSPVVFWASATAINDYEQTMPITHSAEIKETVYSYSYTASNGMTITGLSDISVQTQSGNIKVWPKSETYYFGLNELEAQTSYWVSIDASHLDVTRFMLQIIDDFDNLIVDFELRPDNKNYPWNSANIGEDQHFENNGISFTVRITEENRLEVLLPTYQFEQGGEQIRSRPRDLIITGAQLLDYEFEITSVNFTDNTVNFDINLLYDTPDMDIETNLKLAIDIKINIKYKLSYLGPINTFYILQDGTVFIKGAIEADSGILKDLKVQSQLELEGQGSIIGPTTDEQGNNDYTVKMDRQGFYIGSVTYNGNSGRIIMNRDGISFNPDSLLVASKTVSWDAFFNAFS